MNLHSSIKPSIIFCLLMQWFIVLASNEEIWVDYNNNAQLNLSNDGTFRFSNSAAVLQGSYTVQNNVLMMQDSSGNYYQYNVLSYSTEQMVLSDQNGVSYSYVRSQNSASLNNTQQTNTSFPWDNPQFNHVLSQKNGYQWRERENWIYVEFLQFLIGQPLTQSEIASIRQDFINHFNQDPAAYIKEIKDIETAMTQVYSLINMQQVAMIREEMTTVFNTLVKQQPKMHSFSFVQILNNHVKILSTDTQSNMSLSNQDVDGYINYLQFQAMLLGQNYQLSQQERMTLQVRLASEFNSYSAEQKQTLAFASFIWNYMAQQWANLNASQQNQYIAQIQSQMNIQNTQVNANEFWNSTENYDSSSYDISSIENKYRQEAAAKGMSLNQYLDYKQRDMAVNNQIYTMVQNNMTENHAMMLNIINSDSNYEYVVDYGNNY